ncbi:ribonuclease H-like domain-containing protein [Tanacetum coccineum]
MKADLNTTIIISESIPSLETFSPQTSPEVDPLTPDEYAVHKSQRCDGDGPYNNQNGNLIKWEQTYKHMEQRVHSTGNIWTKKSKSRNVGEDIVKSRVNNDASDMEHTPDSGCHGRCGDYGVDDEDEGGVPTVEMVTGETVMMALAVGGDDDEDGEGGDGSGDRSMVERVLHVGDDEGGDDIIATVEEWHGVVASVGGSWCRLTHPNPKRNFVPRAVLIKSGLKTLNTARQNSSRAAVLVNTFRPINTAYPKPTVNCARPVSNVFNKTHSHVRRPFNKFTSNKDSNLNEKVNTVKGNVTTTGPKVVVCDNKENEANAVKASACWIWRPKQKVLDHGNPQLELQEKRVIDSGCSRHMTGNKGGKITSKGKISTGKLDFEDVYFVKELKFSLFSVSQMCDKKNIVLFTNTECVVLSPDFKLLDETHVLLRVLRKDNMYSVDLKNIIPSGGLTCLFANATLDESNLWHRRLGHINFKTLNKLVRGNLVRGLPSKIFENNHTCVSCQKGKKHKASCKTKTVSSISQPLQMLHMDLFGPTFVKSLMKKMNCLVVTDDYSRCDNGTEFKNKVMIQFCEMKGIKREFSVARTPQQNGVAERKKRILIEAARTMLADSKLPTTFWVEAVNTACKFDGKADEGFFVGYSTNSKAYRVFNSRTRIVEENLHVKFSEETPNIAGNGPNWLFDIDALTISMNYKPVIVGNQTNGNAGTKENIDAGFSCAGFKPLGEEEKMDSEHLENEDSEVQNTEEPRINQEQDANVNSTNNINTIVYSDNDEEVGAEADVNNLATTVPVSPIPTTIVHKDHPLEQIIGDIQSVPQTRRMTKSVTEHVEPKKVNQAMTDPSWIEAMQDKLLQFKLQKVWTLVELPYGRGPLVLNGCIETRKMIEMDVKSAFLYGTIEEDVYVCQPLGFEDLEFPNKVYKLEKALYGLHQALKAWYETVSTYLLENRFRRGTIDKTLFMRKDKGDILLVQVKQKDDGIFMSQDKYVTDILKKFDFATVKTARTPIETNKALLKDEEAADMDVHLYKSMIGSLMYLTASRPDIMFAVYAYARFQVTPNTSHLHAVKRIFRYLKGHPKLGLWKSTTGGCQFLRRRLISWQCKNQTIVVNSTTEAEYVVAANCYRQISVSDCKSGKTEWKRAATTASSLVAEQDSDNINRTQSMATLNESFP